MSEQHPPDHVPDPRGYIADLDNSIREGDEDPTYSLAVFNYYPLIVEIIVVNVEDRETRYHLWRHLDRIHLRAATNLMRAAIRAKLPNSRVISRSQVLCEKLHMDAEGIFASWPTKQYDTWPHCLPPDIEEGLSRKDRDDIWEAEALLMELAATLDIADETLNILGKVKPPIVELRGYENKPLVRGKEVDSLTTQQYDVVNALLEAGGRGLSKDKLVEKSKAGDAVGVLKRLHQKTPWDSVILLPGVPHVGYRIKS